MSPVLARLKCPLFGAVRSVLLGPRERSRQAYRERPQQQRARRPPAPAFCGALAARFARICVCRDGPAPAANGSANTAHARSAPPAWLRLSVPGFLPKAKLPRDSALPVLRLRIHTPALCCVG